MKNLFLLLVFLLSSCANYINQIHSQIDREEKLTRGEKSENLKRDYVPYKNRFDRSKDKRPIKDPRTFSLSDGSPAGEIKPTVKRDYRPQRMKAEDFVDSGDENGSLWASKDSTTSLFTSQTDKHTGDIVIINVLENLRNQISSELKRTFPDTPKKSVQTPNGIAVTPTPQAGLSLSSPTNEAEIDMKVYDKISGTVMEEISKGYILLKGRKEVIFKKEKRFIEVQGLVSRKDILENDYVNSDKMLDSRVFILK